MKKIPGLEWRQHYNEHMGCIKGCLDTLGIQASLPWLFGATGNAFLLNMKEDVDLECPLGWDHRTIHALATNVGYQVEELHTPLDSVPTAEELTAKRKEAWDFIRSYLDRGLPCYGWELSYIPAYYVINGYDDVGYYYSGSLSGGPCPWEKLADYFVRMVIVFGIQPCPPAPDEKVVKDALAEAVARGLRSDGWAINSRFRTGLAGYDLWAESLEAGKANRDGQTYNNQTWLECREMAVEFLKEARQRLPGRFEGGFDEAIAHYTVVRDALAELLEMIPQRGENPDFSAELFQPPCPDGANLIRRAAAAERLGIECLEGIVKTLEL